MNEVGGLPSERDGRPPSDRARSLGLVKPLGFVPDFIDEDPETFHHRPVDVSGRALWVPTLGDKRVLVLGSSQSEDDLDRDNLRKANVSVARRRSGGGGVLVGRDDLVWFDIVLANTDELWTNDVSRSFDWLGAAMSTAMASLGLETTAHHGPMVRTEWSRRVCFAGLGPGELTHDAKKLVGMSQRRTREWARFQVAILRRWSGHEHRRLFRVPDSETSAADTTLERAATWIDRSPNDILEAVVDALATC